MSGDLEGGDESPEDAVSVGEVIGAPDDLAIALCERSLMAMAHSARDRAEVLAERARTVLRLAGLEQVALDALLERLAAEGLIKAGGKQRTDSTHVIAAVAALNRLELAGESVRAALEALTAAHPAWVAQRICVPDFARRYGTPMTSWRPPASQAKRDELAIAYARDGYALLEAVCDSTSPAWLREIPAIDVLRRVLQQNYTRTITGNGREVIKRREKEPEGDGLPPGHIRIASPYDTDARWGVKREEFWLGYKLHVTETCDDPPPCSCRPGQPASRPAAGGRPGGSRAAGREHDRGCARLVFPNLITHVATTDATVTDNQMTGAIHDDLAGKSLTPGRHYLDSGYLSAAVVVSALTTWGIALIGPLLADTSAQARAGHGYARADFAIDYDSKTVTCGRDRGQLRDTPHLRAGSPRSHAPGRCPGGAPGTPQRPAPAAVADLRASLPRRPGPDRACSGPPRARRPGRCQDAHA